MEVSLLAMFKSVVTVVLIPVLPGLLIRKILGTHVTKVSSIMPLISSPAIILIINGIVALNGDKLLESGLLVLIVVILHNGIGLARGFGVGQGLPNEL